MTKGLRSWLCLLLSVSLCCLLTSPSFAENLVSPHYKFSESSLGQNGLQDSSSASYQSQTSTGDLGVGESGSLHYGFQGGSVTTNAPRLSVAVTNSAVSFSPFDPRSPSVATATFQVLNYTSYGYGVFVSGDSPKNVSANHTIPGMAQGHSTPGFEQFGMNLVANALTSPDIDPVVVGSSTLPLGTNPDNGPYSWAYGGPGDVNADGTTHASDGLFHPLNSDYKTTGEFKYNDGDMIASAVKSGGFTNYTISYIINVGRLTPAGAYTSNQQLIVVGTY